MLRRLFLCAVVLHVPFVSLFADNTLTVESRSALSGASEVEVKVFADTDQAILGFSFAASFSDTELSINRIEPGEALTGLGDLETGNDFPWNSSGWFYYPVEEGDYFAVAMISEFPADEDDTDCTDCDYANATIAAGDNQHILSVYFDIDATAENGTDLTIDLREGLGSPSIKPVFTDTDGMSVTPALEDGTLSIVTAPEITSIKPRFTTTAGNAQFTITGENLTADTEVTIGGNEVDEEEFIDATTIKGSYPAHDAGVVSVTVSNPVGENTLADAVTYIDQPTIESVSPSQGQGDVYVTITGTNFTDEQDMDILLNFITQNDFTVVSNTEISCYIPAFDDGFWKNLNWGDLVSILVTTAAGMDTDSTGYKFVEVLPDIVFKRGDGNCDNSVDLSDAITVLSYLFSSTQVKCQAALDANDDDGVDISDAIFLLSYLFAQGDTPAAPFQEPGVDPNDTPSCEFPCIVE